MPWKGFPNPWPPGAEHGLEVAWQSPVEIADAQLFVCRGGRAEPATQGADEVDHGRIAVA
jgi:hypothetical protein